MLQQMPFRRNATSKGYSRLWQHAQSPLTQIFLWYVPVTPQLDGWHILLLHLAALASERTARHAIILTLARAACRLTGVLASRRLLKRHREPC